MTTSKLPEWPDRDVFHKVHKKNGTDGPIEDAEYYDALSEAALARMEALAEYTEHAYGCEKCPVDGYGWKVPMPDDTTECTCGLSELLAACARKEAGR